MAQKILNDPFELGYWREWLRSMGEGDVHIKEMNEKDVRRLRVSISQIVEEGFYFKTRYKDGKLHIRRVTLKEWLAEPRRKI